MDQPLTTKQHQEQAAAASTSATSTSLSASPRNSATTNSSVSGGGSQINSMEVSTALQDGEKFVKWDEVSRWQKSQLGKKFDNYYTIYIKI